MVWKPSAQMELTASARAPLTQMSTGDIPNLLSLLDAFNHRNKNQHRLSPWWSRFDMLRRALRTLVHNSNPDKHRGSARLITQADARWLKSSVIPRCFVSFSQLAADNQHAPLGLMLLVVIARVNTIVNDLLPPSTNDSMSTPPKTEMVLPIQSTSDSKLVASDRGVKVQRNVGEETRSGVTVAESALPTVKRNTTPTEGPRRKKKKKSKDEFSSLFGSLA